MLNPFRIFVLFAILFCLPLLFFGQITSNNIDSVKTKVSFTFSLKKKSITSAGAFKEDGTLLHSIWSGESYEAGTHIKTWDGLDNDGKVIADKYEIKVLSNNLIYNWEGVVGNTLLDTRGNFERIFGMAFFGTKGFAATGYNEQQAMIYSFNTATPQVQTAIGGKGPTTNYVCTDGNYVYWSARDPNDGGKNFVYVTNYSNNAQISLASGTTVTVISSPNYNGIDVYTGNVSAEIKGMAVGSNYLFVSHPNINKLNVLNKTTGALVQSLTYTTPSALAIDGSNLWMATGRNTVAKYRVNADGTLTAPTVTLSNLLSPLGIAVSGSNVSIVDGSTSQQVKTYNTATGASVWTLGTAGGYATSPDVTNDKFYLNDLRTNYGSYIAYQSDGSFWVGDAGNSRSQHYNSSQTFIDRVMWLPHSYASGVDQNNTTRVFSDFLEFEVNYTNLNWALVKNWGYNVITPDDQFARLKGVNTLSNGRTYGFMGKAAGQQELAELTRTGLRYTGVVFGLNSQLYPNGNIHTLYNTNNGSNINWYLYQLQGFDSQNNPKYNNGALVEKSPVITDNDPAFRGNITTLTSGEITSTGKYISFDGNTPPQGGSGYHLGAVKNGKWMWKGAYVTHKEYSGPYPEDGSYDIGNGVNEYSGSKALVQDNIVMWGYHGEFWKNGQVNKWNLVYENGLFIGQFGVVAAGQPVPGMAGNAFSARLIKVGDDMYLYHNDESYRSGVHRWKISGINTIEMQTAAVLSAVIEEDEGLDLMEGLPFNAVLQDNTNGWTRYPLNDDKTDPYSQYWLSKTSVQTITKSSGRDVYAKFRNSTGSATVSRTLGSNIGLNTWTVKGKINFSGNNGNNGFNGGVFFEVVDDKDRIIVRIGEDRNYINESNITRVLWANNQTIIGGKESDVLETLYNPQSLNISGKAGLLTIKYGTSNSVTVRAYDPAANWQNPKSIRLYFFSFNSNYDRIVGISEMKFIPNDTPKTSFTDQFRTAASGSWNDRRIWESSKDGQTWIASSIAPNFLANSMSIRNGHAVSIADSLTVDQLSINEGGELNVLPGAAIYVNNGDGIDIYIDGNARMVFKSDASGTGRIGKSSGNIVGNVTVERFLPAKSNASYRMLAPSVSSKGSIKDNWQQGVNNISNAVNLDPKPGYGTHITGSVSGANGFDATATGQASLFTFNWLTNTPVWIPVLNTNVNKLDAKTAYLIFVRGNREIDLNKVSGQSNNTILSATGTAITGQVNYPDLLPGGRNSAIANPYASPLNWAKLQAANSNKFENYYTTWDPNVGSKGGYVTVDATGATSVRTSEATTDIQSGQAFIVKSKTDVASPTFQITEDDKSIINNPNVFRTANAIVPKLYTSLYFLDENTGSRDLADGVLSRFDATYTNGLDDADAEDISNFDENLALARSGKQLSIESMPLPKVNDTLHLNIGNMKQRAYEWQFNATDFSASSGINAFLVDSYSGTEIPVELDGPTVIIFAITNAPASYSASRFKIIFEQLKILPVKILSVSAAKQGAGIKVDWKTTNEVNVEKYIIQRSSNGQNFIDVAMSDPTGTITSTNNYKWFDRNPLNGYNYYRIKSKDKDGQVQYSTTVRVLTDKFGNALKITPNPVLDDRFQVFVSNLETGDYLVVLTNVAGQTLLKQNIKHPGGDLRKDLSISGFAKGAYQLSLRSTDYNKLENLIIL